LYNFFSQIYNLQKLYVLHKILNIAISTPKLMYYPRIYQNKRDLANDIAGGKTDHTSY